jgi:hypothetical protein
LAPDPFVAHQITQLSADLRGDRLGSPKFATAVATSTYANDSSVMRSSRPSHVNRPWAAHWIVDHFERHRVTDDEIIELDPDQVSTMKEDLLITGLNKAVAHTGGEFRNPSLSRTSTALWWSADLAVRRPPARL